MALWTSSFGENEFYSDWTDVLKASLNHHWLVHLSSRFLHDSSHIHLSVRNIPERLQSILTWDKRSADWSEQFEIGHVWAQVINYQVERYRWCCKPQNLSELLAHVVLVAMCRNINFLIRFSENQFSKVSNESCDAVQGWKAAGRNSSPTFCGSRNTRRHHV